MTLVQEMVIQRDLLFRKKEIATAPGFSEVWLFGFGIRVRGSDFWAPCFRFWGLGLRDFTLRFMFYILGFFEPSNPTFFGL